MEKSVNHKNDCGVKRTLLVRVADWLCGTLLVGITIWVLYRYGALPDRIPTHYGPDGVIDGYGPKSMIWLLIAGAWIGVGIMTAVEQFPRLWNLPFKVTKENQCRVLSLIWHWISTTKLIVLGLFIYLTVMSALGWNLSICFMLVSIGVLVANSLYWVVRLFLNR